MGIFDLSETFDNADAEEQLVEKIRYIAEELNISVEDMLFSVYRTSDPRYQEGDEMYCSDLASFKEDPMASPMQRMQESNVPKNRMSIYDSSKLKSIPNKIYRYRINEAGALIAVIIVILP